METLDKLSKNKAKISVPIEIIEEIITRLPVKSILRFKSVSKPWLFLINNPSFTKFHFTSAIFGHHNVNTSLIITAYDTSTEKHYLLSTTHDDGPITYLMTHDNFQFTISRETAEAAHLHGLVLYSSSHNVPCKNFAFVINPSTHKLYQLPCPVYERSVYERQRILYLFGFDESKNEHKILNISLPDFGSTIECMIFSLSNYSWRKIDVDFPVINVGRCYLINSKKRSVCVNSVIHLMSPYRNEIFAFDLRSEKFLIIKIPKDAYPCKLYTEHTTRKGRKFVKGNQPFLMKIKGLLGVVCHDRAVEKNEIYIWILQDYENRVWVREIVNFSEPWIELDWLLPLDSTNKDEILFPPKKLSKDMLSIPIYDMKTRSFKSVKFFLNHPFLHSESVVFHQVCSYTESLLPLREE